MPTQDLLQSIRESPKPPVYTLGYSGRTPQQIEALVESLDATLFDVRFSPRSRLPQWCAKQLRSLLGDRYHHVREFGNANYKSAGPVELVDFAAGAAAIITWGSIYRSVILMCVCSDPAQCHRTVIAGLLRANGFQVTELDLNEQLPAAQIELF